MPDTDWFVRARYGLIIHYGLYSALGRGEWALNREQIPTSDYKQLASTFTAHRFNAEAIADLAMRAGMRYLTFTTMHHDGFRLYESDLSEFSTARTAARRDLTAEIVNAARKRGLRIALYHSLNNWTDTPDSVDALEDPRAREAFLHNTFARIRELVTRFNPIDTLWYDGWWPLNAEGWRAEAMNDMVRRIQPHILFNGRNGLPGDFATPEGHLGAPHPWRPWEACITMNNSWGFHHGDHEWKTPGQIVDMLATVAAGRGNLMLNIGPRGDGSIPPDSVRVLEAVGAWLKRCGDCIVDTDLFTYDLRERGAHRSDWSNMGPFTAAGNCLFWLIRRWPGPTLTLAGLEATVRHASWLGGSGSVSFAQEGKRVTFSGLPDTPPDPVCPVLRIECDRPPVLYLSGGMREPRVSHPHYDPCPSDIVH